MASFRLIQPKRMCHRWARSRQQGSLERGEAQGPPEFPTSRPGPGAGSAWMMETFAIQMVNALQPSYVRT